MYIGFYYLTLEKRFNVEKDDSEHNEHTYSGKIKYIIKDGNTVLGTIIENVEYCNNCFDDPMVSIGVQKCTKYTLESQEQPLEQPLGHNGYSVEEYTDGFRLVKDGSEDSVYFTKTDKGVTVSLEKGREAQITIDDNIRNYGVNNFNELLEVAKTNPDKIWKSIFK